MERAPSPNSSHGVVEFPYENPKANWNEGTALYSDRHYSSVAPHSHEEPQCQPAHLHMVCLYTVLPGTLI